MPSLHVPATQRRLDVLHELLVQSEPRPQDLPTVHFGQEAPPQSTSVSNPSRRASRHCACTQNPFWHVADVQSFATRHRFPDAHAEQPLPPQSTSVSEPFFAPSVQNGARHVPDIWPPSEPAHTKLWQSKSRRQPPPGGHGAQSGPPQSKSVSTPFCFRSSQRGGPASMLASGADASGTPVSEPTTEPPDPFELPVLEPPLDVAPPVLEPPDPFEPPVLDPPLDVAPPVDASPPVFDPPLSPPLDVVPPVGESPPVFDPPALCPPLAVAPPVTAPLVPDAPPALVAPPFDGPFPD
jgi:hypothetical protein